MNKFATLLGFSAALAIGLPALAMADDTTTTTKTIDRPGGDVTKTWTKDQPTEGRAADDCNTRTVTRTNDATDKTVTRSSTNCR